MASLRQNQLKKRLSDLISQCNQAYFKRDLRNQHKSWDHNCVVQGVIRNSMVGTRKEYKKEQLVRKWYGLNEQVILWIAISETDELATH